MIDETRARELYVRIKALREHQQKLESHIQELDQKTVQLRDMITAVQESTSIKAGDELLVPLASGIFMPATAKPVEHFVLHVGADAAVKKTPKETEDILEGQLTELAQFRSQLIEQYQELLNEVERVEREAEHEVGNV